MKATARYIAPCILATIIILSATCRYQHDTSSSILHFLSALGVVQSRQASLAGRVNGTLLESLLGSRSSPVVFIPPLTGAQVEIKLQKKYASLSNSF
jgi:hypothetical protein